MTEAAMDKSLFGKHYFRLYVETLLQRPP